MPEFSIQRGARLASTALCIVGWLPLSGCLFGKKPVRIFVSPPIAAKQAPEPQELDLPPDVEDFSADVDPAGEGLPQAVAGLPPAPPKPVAPKPRPTAPATPPDPAPVVGPTPSTPKPVTTYSTEERRQMTKELDDMLERVRRALARTTGRKLSGDLAAMADQARTFAEQAEQTRSRDLSTAVNLAKRADLFAIDLLARLP